MIKNVRLVDNTNPVTGEVTKNKVFTTILKNINKTNEYQTGGENPKMYYIGTIDINGKLFSCRIPATVADTVSVGDEVNVSATQLEKITAFTVIGNAAIGTSATADVFDSIEESVPVQAGKVENVEA